MSGIEFTPDDMGRGLTASSHDYEDSRHSKPGEDPGNMHSQDIRAILKMADAYRGRESDPEGDAPLPTVLAKYLTIGNLVTLATVVGGGFALYYGVKDDLRDLHHSVEQHEIALHDIVVDRDKYRDKYRPMVEAQESTNKRQDDNMSTMRESILQLRDSVSTLAKVSAETHEDVAVMKNMLQGRSFPAPPSRN